MSNAVKYSIMTGTCMAALFASGMAYAANTPAPLNDWYGGFSGDVTWLRHSNTGGGGNVDLGYRFSDWRLEAEAGYHAAGGSNGYNSSHYFTYMGNAYYDFNSVFSPMNSGWHVVPYIGGGVGDAAVHFGNTSFSNTFHHHQNDFAYQGMAGLTFVDASMPNTDWSLGYRYLGTNNSDLHANNIELGIRFHF